MIVRQLQDVEVVGQMVVACDGQCEAVRSATKANGVVFSVSEATAIPAWT